MGVFKVIGSYLVLFITWVFITALSVPTALIIAPCDVIVRCIYLPL
jgi:hypothetical protein